MENNIAFIDWQNLHLWTSNENWKVDFKRFRIYLKEKYLINEVYLFLWFLDENEQKLYTKLQKSWFILIFREHNSNMKWKKKWNVDVDIVFEIMRKLKGFSFRWLRLYKISKLFNWKQFLKKDFVSK